MYAARDRPLPLGPMTNLFPYLSMVIMTFLAIFRLVQPLIEQGSEALKAIRDNDRQVRNV